MALRDAGGPMIQTRHTPVSTAVPPVADDYTGLISCVSVNTAVATQVGKRRVTYQPSGRGDDPAVGMLVRVDGATVRLSPVGLDLGSGGRLRPSAAGDGIEILYPDGTVLVATPHYWPPRACGT